MRLLPTTVRLGSALAVALPSRFIALSDPHPHFAGSWLLNLEKSDSQRDQARTGLSGRPRGPRGGGGGGGRPPEGVTEGFPVAGPGGGDRGLSELLRPKQRLEIVQTDTLITLTDDAGWVRELLPSGQTMREDLGQGGPADVETHWKGDKLVAERKLDRGGVFKETFTLEKKSGRLIVEMSYKTDRMPKPIEGRRVYDPATAGP